jgi:hypothetical protein
MTTHSALDLPVPRNLTSLLQQLQRLAGIEEHEHYCAGLCPITKLRGFVEKMQDRYPLTRSARQRSYDRTRGLAVAHLIVYPHWEAPGTEPTIAGRLALGNAHARHAHLIEALHRHHDSAKVAWWMLSGEGRGGLSDPHTPDAHVACDARRTDQHITYQDYVLLYAHKMEPREIRDPRGRGGSRSVLKDTSTWTFSLQRQVIRELKAVIDEHCMNLVLGHEPSAAGAGYGLRGFLHAQRQRPLFSGVRTQVLQLERYARDQWRSRAHAMACDPPGGRRAVG